MSSECPEDGGNRFSETLAYTKLGGEIYQQNIILKAWFLANRLVLYIKLAVRRAWLNNPRPNNNNRNR
jgi:hypothetical protein